jgi:hypothetical protein
LYVAVVPAVPPEFQCLTGLMLYIDTNVVDADDPAAADLRRLHQEGWIQLQRTDTVDTELASAPVEKRDRLLGLSRPYVESLGPMVADHSRADFSVGASDGDGARIRTAYGILHGGAARLRDNDLRDAMHVATAIRYGAFGFVTFDKKLLRKADAVRNAFGGFYVLDPSAARLEGMERVRRLRIVNAARNNPAIVPEWPDAEHAL